MEKAEREQKKLIPLAMIRIMEEYTDDTHALEMAEIKELIKEKYGINIDRRTAYSTVHLLNDFGYDIHYGYPYEGCLKRGYYLANRDISEEDCADALLAVRGCDDFEQIKAGLLKHFSKYQKINIEYAVAKK